MSTMSTRYHITTPCAIDGAQCQPGDVMLHAADGSWTLLRAVSAGAARAALSAGVAIVEHDGCAVAHPRRQLRLL